MEQIPEDYIAFLHWLKNATEHYWSIDPSTRSREAVAPGWSHGAKWVGMTEEQIDKVQEKYDIIFTPEHRAFLNIMHTLDRKEKVYDDYDHEEGPYEERSFFHNWLEDDDDIRFRLNDVYDWMSEDVEKGKFWLNSWGIEPAAACERRKAFDQLFNCAPKLVPVTSHRYQVADMSFEFRPVLSIRGTDIVYYGSDFRYFLLNELASSLDIYHLVYDRESDCWYPEVRVEYEGCFEYYDKKKLPQIPFWKGFYLFDWTNHDNNKGL